MPEAVIVDAVRSPIGRAFKGSLTGIRPDDLGAYVVDALLDRNPGVDPASVQDLICGCGLPQGEQSYNIGRAVAMLSRLPVHVTGATVARYCASSLPTRSRSVTSCARICASPALIYPTRSAMVSSWSRRAGCHSWIRSPTTSRSLAAAAKVSPGTL